MSGEIINTTGRSIAAVTAEINILTEQLWATALQKACQIGKRLIEAKALVAHGEWGDYLEHEIGYKSSTANNYMRLFKEYGETGPNSQSIGNLPPTHVIRLLSLPADEREEFAETHDAANLSAAELQRQISEHKARADKAEEADAAKAQLLQLATEENCSLKQRLDSIDADYKQQLDVVDKENDKLRSNAEDLKHRLDEALARPAEISEEQAEKLRQEGAEAAASAAQERITAAQAMQKAAEDRNADLQSRIDDLQTEIRKKDEAKPTAMTDPDAALFEVTLQQIGELSNRLIGLRMKAQGRNPRVAAAMTAALKKFAAAFAAQVEDKST